MKKITYLLLLAWLIAGCRPAKQRLGPVPTAATSSTSPAASTSPEVVDPFQAARARMVATTIENRDISDPQVLNAMLTVPRHEFVPSEFHDQAYDDHPLPIGYGQTISQPYIVAWMTELLELKPGEKVLEIGTGSGYQAAILAQMEGVEVYSIEIVPELADGAAERLARLGYTDIRLLQADGYYGWAEQAPFDAIIVTAAPDHLPAPLVAQLSAGGRLVIPIGPPGGYQALWKFVNEGEPPASPDNLKAYNMGGVIFVPFTGGGVQEGSGATAIP